MKTSGAGRVLAAVFIGVIGGIYLRFHDARVLAMGRQGATEAYGRTFDRLAANHAGSLGTIVAGLVLSIAGYGLYEMIAAGFTRLMSPSEAEE